MTNYKKENKEFIKNYNIDECFKEQQKELESLTESIKALRGNITIIVKAMKALEKKVDEKTKVVLQENDYKQIIKLLKNE